MFALLLLTTQFAIGQPDTPTEAPAAPAVASPAAAPPPQAERWLLLRSLQGTWEGDALDSRRLQVYGWTDVSYTASTAERTQLPMGFNYVANDFLLQQNWLRIERPVVTSATSEPSFGFRSDWILPGSDYRFTLARGIFDGQLTASDGRPNRYGVDPIQFYAQAYFPTIAHGLDVKFGRIFCQYGVETNDAPGNALLSHAYTFIYDPFTHTGIMVTLKPNDAWSIQAGAMLGSDVFVDRADVLTGMGSVKWAPPNGRDSVALSVIIGPGRFDAAHNFNNPDILDLVYTHQINARLTYSFESLAGYQSSVPAVGAAHWFGVVNYLTGTLTPRLSATTRLEFFDDEQGQRTGFRGTYSALTAGVAFKPWKSVIVRPELRYDYNGRSRPFEEEHGVFTAAADVILRW